MFRSIKGLNVLQIVELLERCHADDKFIQNDRQVLYELAFDERKQADLKTPLALGWSPSVIARAIRTRPLEITTAILVALALE